MKGLLSAILVCCLCFGNITICAADGNGSGIEQLLLRAEQLANNYKDSEALELYGKVLLEDATNYEALCSVSKLHSRIGNRYINDETSKLEHFNKAKAYATKAYELKPEDAEANFVMALALGNMALISGPKQRLSYTNQIKSFLDAALANNPHHSGAWHVLGRWYFKMANLNFAETAATKLFFGGVCEQATNEDAVKAMEQAIAYDSMNIRFYYDLACIYDEMKDRETCMYVLQQALTLNLETKEELELSRRCKLMLQALQNNS
ncbi:tetratricopeptide repeat protein [Pontibacter harenae]|uniref:tetratricopeptide repeat protein n=1 Tax=Pontibacter harenae TaxID=2894083 RepID=UPI001E41D6C1|nr:hypothetical protein [Pontibacter harenae]MCC9166959.1 hypothetical protein [Pontibacter harenae]